MVLALEFVVAEPPGGAPPAQRLSTDQPDAHPIVRIVRIVGVRILLFVGPQVGVEFARLGDVREAAGAPESAIGQIVHRFERFVPLEVYRRTGVQHEAFHPFAGERVRHHASGRAGTDNEDVTIAKHSYSIGNQYVLSPEALRRPELVDRLLTAPPPHHERLASTGGRSSC